MPYHTICHIITHCHIHCHIITHCYTHYHTLSNTLSNTLSSHMSHTLSHTLSHLKMFSQEKHRTLSRDQALMTEVNTLARQLQLTADQSSRDNIEASLTAINQQWSELTDLASEQHSGLSVCIHPSVHLSILAYCLVPVK